MPDRFAYDVFLSHNSKDKPRVRELAEDLRGAGLRVWFDEWVIRPGDDIYLAIERGLEAARVQVLCLSPAALGSDWVALERSTVLFRDPSNAGQRFIPLLLADCELPSTLRRYKYVDYRRESKAAFEELLAACRAEAESPPAVAVNSARTPTRPPEETEPLAVLERELTGHAGWVNSVAVSPGATWAASGSHDGTVRIWDLETGACRVTLKGHKHVVTAVAIAPDGRRILSTSWDKSIRIWDVETSTEVIRLLGHTDAVLSAVFLAKGRKILSGGSKQELKLWDVYRQECERGFKGHAGGGICSVAVNGAGDRAISGGTDKEIRCWDLATGSCLDVLAGHSSHVRSVQITANGRFAVSGSDDRTVKVWDLEAGICVRTLRGHQNEVHSVAISLDGGLIASTGFQDDTVRLWDLKSGAGLQVIEHERKSPTAVAFSPDGSRLLVGTASAAVILVYRLTSAHVAPPAEATRHSVNAKGTYS